MAGAIQEHRPTLRPAFYACARLDLIEEVKPHYRDLGGWTTEQQLPIVYHDIYNIRLFGIEKLHPFDSNKFDKVKRSLEKQGLIRRSQLVTAVEATREMLLDVHTQQYMDELCNGWRKLQEITEAPCLCLVPNALVQARLHKPMRFHISGTILALALALQHGWSINLGGGMHHAHAENGSGWCIYDDWMLAIRRLRRASGGKVRKALYIDLDVHQGNGVARDKLRFGDADFFILDMYNSDLWPADAAARRGIDHEVTITSGCRGREYLAKLGPALEHCFSVFKPDIVLYNAGTDILAGDPLGRCKVDAESVVKRDEMVWQAALNDRVPICMALAGGYARNSAAVISTCLAHILRTFNLVMPGHDRRQK